MHDRRGESGQVMIIAALAMAAMMAFLALVIDIGNAFAQRRMMQNAADAAAIAGARHLALSLRTGTSDGAVAAAIAAFLTENGDAEPVTATGPSRAWLVDSAGARIRALGAGGIPAVPVGSTPAIVGVEVVAGRDVDTYFGTVLGAGTIPVGATSVAAYGSVSQPFLDSTRSGVPVGPLVLDERAYANALSRCGGFGAPLNFSLYIDTPSDCATGPDMHFSYTTLNIGNNCSNNTVREVADDLINDPTSLGDAYVRVGETEIRVCHGARLANPDLIADIGRSFIVPLISHADAEDCHPQCYARVVSFAYVRILRWRGSGVNMWYEGSFVDPRTMPPLVGQDIVTGGAISGPVSFSLIR